MENMPEIVSFREYHNRIIERVKQESPDVVDIALFHVYTSNIYETYAILKEYSDLVLVKNNGIFPSIQNIDEMTQLKQLGCKRKLF